MRGDGDAVSPGPALYHVKKETVLILALPFCKSCKAAAVAAMNNRRVYHAASLTITQVETVLIRVLFAAV